MVNGPRKCPHPRNVKNSLPCGGKIILPPTGLLQAVVTAVEMVRDEKNGGAIPVPDYVDENVSDKVVKIIQSYTGVVNKMVWRKY